MKWGMACSQVAEGGLLREYTELAAADRVRDGPPVWATARGKQILDIL